MTNGKKKTELPPNKMYFKIILCRTDEKTALNVKILLNKTALKLCSYPKKAIGYTIYKLKYRGATEIADRSFSVSFLCACMYVHFTRYTAELISVAPLYTPARNNFWANITYCD